MALLRDGADAPVLISADELRRRPPLPEDSPWNEPPGAGIGHTLRFPGGPVIYTSPAATETTLGQLLTRAQSRRLSGHLRLDGDRWAGHVLIKEGVPVRAAFLPPRSAPQFGPAGYVAMIGRARVISVGLHLTQLDSRLVESSAGRFLPPTGIPTADSPAATLRNLMQALHARSFTGCVEVAAGEQWAAIALHAGTIVGAYSWLDARPVPHLASVAAVAALPRARLVVYRSPEREVPLPSSAFLLERDESIRSTVRPLDPRPRPGDVLTPDVLLALSGPPRPLVSHRVAASRPADQPATHPASDVGRTPDDTAATGNPGDAGAPPAPAATTASLDLEAEDALLSLLVSLDWRWENARARGLVNARTLTTLGEMLGEVIALSRGRDADAASPRALLAGLRNEHPVVSYIAPTPAGVEVGDLIAHCGPMPPRTARAAALFGEACAALLAALDAALADACRRIAEPGARRRCGDVCAIFLGEVRGTVDGVRGPAHDQTGEA